MKNLFHVSQFIFFWKTLPNLVGSRKENQLNQNGSMLLSESIMCQYMWQASVVNHTIVTDPAVRQPGFNLPRHTWSLMNHFRTGQGPSHANLHKWGLAQSPSCDCGQRQTMNHIVDTCPLTKFEGGLNLLHKADDDAVIWLESTATAALAK